ncbi:hypothetical protein THAOC_05343 [Thalassiosira oceanica]|uniref:Uncharacterized protein n=1 Tax=Thalassiosira oceanica TaxID=159749 RepID=K0T313_THAOC|nr:hypothetical protein THAOC_05343 [Thalassiosira oceanica]|eukprot:EJK73058.1 hypothetical protein THAOC_05343 [Thalassiosira oceanica]
MKFPDQPLPVLRATRPLRDPIPSDYYLDKTSSLLSRAALFASYITTLAWSWSAERFCLEENKVRQDALFLHTDGSIGLVRGLRSVDLKQPALMHRRLSICGSDVLAIPASNPDSLPPPPKIEPVQHQTARDADVQTRRAASVLRYPHEAVARRHLLRTHAAPLIPHNEGGRGGKRLRFEVHGRLIDFHAEDRHSPPPIVAGSAAALDVHGLYVRHALVEPVEPYDLHGPTPDALAELRGHVRPVGVGVELERRLADYEDRGAAERSGELEEVAHVLALRDVGEDQDEMDPISTAELPFTVGLRELDSTRLDPLMASAACLAAMALCQCETWMVGKERVEKDGRSFATENSVNSQTSAIHKQMERNDCQLGRRGRILRKKRCNGDLLLDPFHDKARRTEV